MSTKRRTRSANNYVKGQFCSARKRGSGWSLRWTQAGKQHEQRLGKIDRAGALRAVMEADRKLSGGGLSAPSRETLRDALARFLEDRAPRVTESTLKRGYKHKLGPFFREIGDNLKVSNVTRELIQQHVNAMIGKGRSVAGLRSMLTAARTFFAWCGREGDNPAEKINLPRSVSRIAEPYPSKIELLKLLGYAETVSEAVYLAMSIAFYSGARITSILRLQWEDVDFKNNRITFRERGAESLKGKKEYTVPLHPDLKKIFAPRKGSGQIITNPEKRRSEAPSTPLRRQLDKVRAVAKKNKWTGGPITWHRFRHSFAGFLLSKGESIYKVSRWLGHSSVSVTQNAYGHLVDEAEKGIEKL